jgi:hypothetical protein
MNMKDELTAMINRIRNRRIYRRLDIAILRAIPDADLEMAIVDYVGTKLKDNYDRDVEIVGALAAGVRATYLTWVVVAEVQNGGFNQYYFNTDGKFASEAVIGFEYFGARELAALMMEANSIRASEAAEMAKYKEQGTWQAFEESYKRTDLNHLDARLYELYKSLSPMRIARIREMPEEFAGE